MDQQVGHLEDSCILETSLSDPKLLLGLPLQNATQKGAALVGGLGFRSSGNI